MAKMFKSIMEYLQGISTLTAIVPAERIQPLAMRKGTPKPYIVVSRIARTDSADFAGNTTFCEADTFEFDVVVDDTDDGEDIAEILINNFDGRPSSNMGTTAPVYVNSIRFRDELNYTDSDQTGKDAYGFHWVLVFDFGYSKENNVFAPIIDDYQYFYEFGDSGGAFIDDTAGNQNLVNSNATQSTDPVQGEVALFTSSPTNQGLTNMGWPVGNVDKSLTAIINSDNLFFNMFQIPAASGIVQQGFSDIFIATTAGFGVWEYLASGTGFWYSLGLSITSDFTYRVYINGIEIPFVTGALPGAGTLDLGSIATGGFLGKIGKVRIFNRIKTPAEFVLIDAEDRKI